MIDFAAIKSAALASAESLLAEWFPAGTIIDGEFRIGDVHGSPGKSLAVTLSSGLWNDRAGTDAGGDLISLYAASRGISQSDAAQAIAQRLGLNGTNGSSPARPILPNPAPAPKPAESDGWEPLPEAEPVFPPAEHPSRGTPSLVHTYRTLAGKIIGYVYRFDGPDGKAFAPLSWCRHTDGRTAWRWKAPARPRPLYNLPALADAARPVLIVEGEKTADAAAVLLPGYAVLSWSGGSKAPQLADWSPLLGREVIIWPDADAPGTKAAATIATQLPDAIVLRVPDGWQDGYDLADAARDGWTTARVETHIACERQRLASEYEATRRSDPVPTEPDIDTPPPTQTDSSVFADAPFSVTTTTPIFTFQMVPARSRPSLLNATPRPTYWLSRPTSFGHPISPPRNPAHHGMPPPMPCSSPRTHRGFSPTTSYGGAAAGSTIPAGNLGLSGMGVTGSLQAARPFRCISSNPNTSTSLPPPSNSKPSHQHPTPRPAGLSTFADFCHGTPHCTPNSSPAGAPSRPSVGLWSGVHTSG